MRNYRFVYKGINVLILMLTVSHICLKSTLPESSAEYANEVFKSSYNLGFLGVTTLTFDLIYFPYS